MNINATDQVPEDTNNLQSNIVQRGSIAINSSDWSATGATFGASPARNSYYATKSITLPIKKSQVPIVYAWYQYYSGSDLAGYIRMNFFSDWENPFIMWNRWWYTLTASGSQLSLTVCALDQLAVSQVSTIYVYYVVVSASITESSGL